MNDLGTPLTLNHGRAWPNRLMLAPLTNKQSNPDGTLSDDEFAWLLARARGGFGLTMTAAAYVNQAGKAWEGQLGVHDDAMLPGLLRLAEGIRAAGSVSSVQLHHGGAVANPAATGQPLVGPVNLPEKGVRAMTTEEVQQLVADFATAAARVERAGFDGAELHGAHGYLLTQFLALTNTRTDGYGGSAEGRARVLFEIIEAVRAATGPNFQVGVRLSAERFGLSTPEMIELAGALLLDERVDYLDMSLWDVRKHREDAPGQELLATFAALPRGGTRLGVTGKLGDSAALTAALADGADFVAVGRAAIAEAGFAAKAMADPAYAGPHFPVSKDQLREQCVGEAFVEYFAAGWPQLVAG